MLLARLSIEEQLRCQPGNGNLPAASALPEAEHS